MTLEDLNSLDRQLLALYYYESPLINHPQNPQNLVGLGLVTVKPYISMGNVCIPNEELSTTLFDFSSGKEVVLVELTELGKQVIEASRVESVLEYFSTFEVDSFTIRSLGKILSSEKVARAIGTLFIEELPAFLVSSNSVVREVALARYTMLKEDRKGLLSETLFSWRPYSLDMPSRKQDKEQLVKLLEL